jgi:hypothetical protein
MNQIRDTIIWITNVFRSSILYVYNLIIALTLPAINGRGFLNLRHNLLNQAGTRKSRGFISASVAYV